MRLLLIITHLISTNPMRPYMYKLIPDSVFSHPLPSSRIRKAGDDDAYSDVCDLMHVTSRLLSLGSNGSACPGSVYPDSRSLYIFHSYDH